MQIVPTLVIGIGSSGLEVAESVRELMMEEFQTPGFPVVRFLNITSHFGGERSYSDDFYTEDYQKMEEVEISITPQMFDSIEFKLREDSGQTIPGLKDWFDKRLMNENRTELEKGMANKRGLGRLALWLNWDKVTDAIDRNINALQNVVNSNKTNELVNQYLNDQNPNNDSNASLVSKDIYVVLAGSLHGGTCSGTFLDISYYIKDKFQNVTIIAHLTHMDDGEAQKANNQRLSANAYSALIETDYFSAKEAVFELFFPGQNYKKTQSAFPFTRIFLLSTRNSAGKSSAVVTTNGEVKLENLHKVIGLSIFFDAVAGKQSKTEGFRTNWGEGLFDRRVNSNKRLQKIFCTYGSLAFWYPKVRISGAAACLYLKEQYLDYWIGNKQQYDSSNADLFARKAAQDLFEKIRGIISIYTDTGTDNSTTISASTSGFIQNMKDEIGKKNLNVGELLVRLREEPKGNPSAGRYKLNGFYSQQILAKIGIAVAESVNFSGEKLNILIDGIYKSESVIKADKNYLSLTGVLDYKTKFMEYLREKVSNRPNLPSDNINYDEIKVLLDQIKKENDRWLTILVFMRKEVLNQYFERFAEQITSIYEEAEALLLNHHIGIVLEQSIPAIDRNMTKIIGETKVLLDDLYDKAGKVGTDLLKIDNFTTLQIITKTGSIKSDVDDVKSKLNSAEADLILFDIKPLLKKKQKSTYIFNSIRSRIQNSFLKLQDLKDFKVSEKLDSSRLKSHLDDLQPLFEPSPAFIKHQYPKGQNPNVVAGGDTEIREMIETYLGASDAIGKFDIKLDVNMNHLVYMYKEESGIAFGELKAYQGLEAQYKIVSVTDATGIHTDRDPRKFDIEKLLNYHEMLDSQWFKVSLDLFCDEIFGGLQEDKQNMTKFVEYKYINQYKIEERMIFEINNKNKFYDSMKENAEAFKSFREKYKQLWEVHNKISFKNHYVEKYLKAVEQELGPTSPVYEKEDKFYKDLLDKKWPDKK